MIGCGYMASGIVPNSLVVVLYEFAFRSHVLNG